MKYAIFYSVATNEKDIEYMEKLEIRMKDKNFVPIEQDKGYLVKIDDNNKIIYD